MKKLIIFFAFAINIYAQEWVQVDAQFDPPGNYTLMFGTFVDENNGWFTDPYDKSIWHSVNGGLIWIKQKDIPDCVVWELQFNDLSVGWVLTKEGGDNTSNSIWKTTDGGNEWIEYQAPDATKIYFLNRDIGIAAGKDGINKTTDGGISWINVYIQTTLQQCGMSSELWIGDIFFLDDKKGWAAGHLSGYIEPYCGLILSTTDGGNTWISHEVSPEIGGITPRIHFMNDQYGFLLSLISSVSKTSDAGESWNRIKSFPETLYDITVYDNFLWVAGAEGVIYKINTDGSQWIKYQAITNTCLLTFAVTKDNSTSYLFGDNNTLLKYIKPVGVDDENNNDLPSNFELFQNYPNPFNPSTLLSYTIPEQSMISLKVYDSLGREVTTLENGIKSAGIYNLNFDAAGLSTGIYFYTINAGNFIQTKKMLLLR